MNQKEKTVKRHIRNDIILISCLLLIAAVGFFCLFVLRGKGDLVRVTVDGREYGIYSLSRDVTEDIYTGENKEYHNRLVIKDGRAYVETANCPDGICAAHPPVFRNGESIVCLPHRVVISVVTEDKDAPDVVI
ncbi:MAG: NusG domain II-containing protein [Clostridia bacterium]|nr:NusG domain II-containing protein [Clostridia bacterium]